MGAGLGAAWAPRGHPREGVARAVVAAVGVRPQWP